MKKFYYFQDQSKNFFLERRFVFLDGCNEIPDHILDVMENPEESRKLAEDLNLNICQMSLEEADFHDRMARSFIKLEQLIDNEDFDKAKKMIEGGRQLINNESNEPYKTEYLKQLKEIDLNRGMQKGFVSTDRLIREAVNSIDGKSSSVWNKLQDQISKGREYLENYGKESPKYSLYIKELDLRELDIKSKSNQYNELKINQNLTGRVDYHDSVEITAKMRENAKQFPEKTEKYFNAIDELETEIIVQEFNRLVKIIDGSISRSNFDFAREYFKKAKELLKQGNETNRDAYEEFNDKLGSFETKITEGYFDNQLSKIDRFLPNSRMPQIKLARDLHTNLEAELGQNKWNVQKSEKFAEYKNQIKEIPNKIESKVDYIMNENFQIIDKCISENSFARADKILKNIAKWCENEIQGLPKYDSYVQRLDELKNNLSDAENKISH